MKILEDILPALIDYLFFYVQTSLFCVIHGLKIKREAYRRLSYKKDRFAVCMPPKRKNPLPLCIVMGLT